MAQRVSALAERAFPGWEALRELAAWACQQEEMLPGRVAAVAFALLAQAGAGPPNAQRVESAGLSQF